MLTAVEYLGKVGVGITSPHFFRADDTKIYVVKLQNNRLGPKVLVNEFIAAWFGQIMGLCFPPSGIIEIREQLLQENPYLQALDVNLGRHFASLYLDNAEYLEKHNLGNAANIDEMAGVMLFDHLFHNADRGGNKRNLLIRQEEAGRKIYAIDNSHLFRSGNWTIRLLENLGERKKVYGHSSFQLLLKDYLSPQDFLPYLEQVTKLDEGQIENLVRAIPVEWLPDEAERQALTRHIGIRRDMAEAIWKNLCKYIPRSRGGSRWLQGR